MMTDDLIAMVFKIWVIIFFLSITVDNKMRSSTMNEGEYGLPFMDVVDRAYPSNTANSNSASAPTGYLAGGQLAMFEI